MAGPSVGMLWKGCREGLLQDRVMPDIWFAITPEMDLGLA